MMSAYHDGVLETIGHSNRLQPPPGMPRVSHHNSMMPHQYFSTPGGMPPQGLNPPPSSSLFQVPDSRGLRGAAGGMPNNNSIANSVHAAAAAAALALGNNNSSEAHMTNRGFISSSMMGNSGDEDCKYTDCWKKLHLQSQVVHNAVNLVTPYTFTLCRKRNIVQAKELSGSFKCTELIQANFIHFFKDGCKINASIGDFKSNA